MMKSKSLNCLPGVIRLKLEKKVKKTRKKKKKDEEIDEDEDNDFSTLSNESFQTSQEKVIAITKKQQKKAARVAKKPSLQKKDDLSTPKLLPKRIVKRSALLRWSIHIQWLIQTQYIVI